MSASTMAYSFYYTFIFLSALTYNSYEIKLIRRIEAIGMPYYKITMTLGTCQEHILFNEYKAWPVVKMNRIFDIYYKSEADYTISSVAIELVVNNTDCLGFSKTGVGNIEFSATIFFAINMAAVFYSLTIYTCSPDFKADRNQDHVLPELPFYTIRRKLLE